MFDLSLLNNVVDLSETDGQPAVLNATTADGLLGRSLLADQPLSAALYEAERPRFCLLNRRKGVTVAGTDGVRSHRPGRDYAGLALVTDCRIIFAVGQSDGDRTITVAYTGIESVGAEDRFLGETLVVETAEKVYRFPCWGTLAPVVEYARQVGTAWSSADDHLDRARRAIERLDERLRDGSAADASEVLSLLEDVDTELTDAHDAVEALSGGVAAVRGEIDGLRADVRRLRRRAYATRGDRLVDRATERFDDGAYEAAFDDLDGAVEDYRSALSVDADEPPAEDLRDRREEAVAERERLTGSPEESATFAREMAEAADDPGEAIRWWETAVERYDAVYTLDWGREECRFDVDREAVRESLADAVAHLIEAYCAAARDQADEGEQYHYSDPRTAAHDEAAELLAKAEQLARERHPEKQPVVSATKDEIGIERGASPDSAERPPDVDESPSIGFDSDADV